MFDPLEIVQISESKTFCHVATGQSVVVKPPTFYLVRRDSINQSPDPWIQPNPFLVSLGDEVPGRAARSSRIRVWSFGETPEEDAKCLVLLQREVVIHGLYTIRSQSDQPLPYLPISSEDGFGIILGDVLVNSTLLAENLGKLLEEFVGVRCRSASSIREHT